jgi:hypothetical protein
MQQILAEYRSTTFSSENATFSSWLKNHHQGNPLTLALSGVSYRAWWNENFPFERPLPQFGNVVVTEEYYILARKNLMSMIILLDNKFLESLALMKKFLPQIPPQLLNQHKFQDSSVALQILSFSDEDLALVKLYNRWDFKLYEFAVRLFAHQLLFTL